MIIKRQRPCALSEMATLHILYSNCMDMIEMGVPSLANTADACKPSGNLVGRPPTSSHGEDKIHTCAAQK
jgi:hypothetical protein